MLVKKQHNITTDIDCYLHVNEADVVVGDAAGEPDGDALRHPAVARVECDAAERSPTHLL